MSVLLALLAVAVSALWLWPFLLFGSVLVGAGGGDPLLGGLLTTAAPLGWAVAPLFGVAPRRIEGRTTWEPTLAERDAVLDAVALLGGPLPRRVLVVHGPAASVCGTTLAVNRRTIRGHALVAIVAHELAHLRRNGQAIPDGRLVLAVYRLDRWGLLRWPTAVYMRRREAAADDYAAGLGHGSALAAWLAVHSVGAREQRWWSHRRTHPPVATRIRRLASQPRSCT